MSVWTRWLSQLKNRLIGSTLATPYDHWTRQQLVDRLAQLDRPQSLLPTSPPRPLTDYPQHRIALRVAYLGWRYHGFAAQKDTDQTIEGELFKAMTQTNLIDPSTMDYSRCGRTDKGVSGLGQVIALNVRRYNTPTMPYIELLNGILPDDIRITAWSPVSPTFNARFDCLSRTYRYMFLEQSLDINLMKSAAQQLVGSHDFRNFCKLDPSKQTSHTRHIHSIDILPTRNGGDGDTYQVVIKGSAFLWHQVRYIMSILFLIGQHLESPSIIPQLLAIDKVPARPDFPMASHLPLVLAHCEFPKGSLEWRYGRQPYRLQQHWQTIAYDHAVKSWLAQTAMESHKDDLLNNNNGYVQKPTSTVILGAGSTLRTTKYRPLLSRACADSEQLKREKYHAKLARKAATTP